MTPKEKAQEMLLSYKCILNDARIAKRCALIAVDEIIKAHVHNEGVRHLKWWEEVKQEIEKL
jgi:hypothetical protein